MKRTYIVIAAFFAVVVLAIAQTQVSSVNVVGYRKFTVPSNGLSLVAVPFDAVSGSSINISNLIGNQLPNGCKIYMWDRTSNNYITCMKSRGQWPTPVGTSTLYRGDGFWVQVPSGVSTNVLTEVTFLGEVPDSVIDSNTLIQNLVGIDAIGNPYPNDIVWTNTVLARDAANGSKLYIWTNGATYAGYTKSRGAWTTPADFTIKAGDAFWFETVSVTNWSVVCPYDLNN